ncbi:DUF3508 domain containing protein [Trypanosoma rangeli]|uniref:DUF3508 domain containing protein n=1 Tax=Trypanosoma rangeli TaxID=5698 RepID=A0A422NFC3_TRYRA|nr:DUF3508 domain containing protein [Trypanosoma rangeli]RNF04165.1 DUF3508 domain containing protein [Trypanosoma rangeli]|eukprot:RNF04165.1 DUF3508 domain containing protein [Trypanosoma rangeli]
MDVAPALAKEIVRRLLKRTNESTALNVTEELATFVVRLSLFNSPQSDGKGNVAETPEAIELMAETLSNYFANCSPHVLATLSLQCQTAGLLSRFVKKRRNDQVKQEAVTLRLLGSLCENSTRLPEEILSEIAFFILHRYRQLSATQGKLGPTGGDRGGPARRATAVTSSGFCKSDSGGKEAAVGGAAPHCVGYSLVQQGRGTHGGGGPRGAEGNSGKVFECVG